MQLIDKIQEKIKQGGTFKDCENFYYVCKELEPTEAIIRRKWLAQTSFDNAVRSNDVGEKVAFRNLQKRTLLDLAPVDFDSYCQYIEWERELEKKFYMPRRPQLYPITQDMQELNDNDELELLGISTPPGVGKSTLAIFYLCWFAGKYPDEPILGGSHSNGFLRGVYDECLRVMTSPEYLWRDVFPGVAVCNTNAKDMRIDLGTPKRFETLEFSSIGSGNAGKVRAKKLLYCDDLVEGSEVALSRDRLDKLWQVYTDDLRQRKQGKCKELIIATRWSVHDPLGRLEDMYAGSNKAKFVCYPALNENDESNFDYPFNLGFSTEVYHRQRMFMDDVSWSCLYMNQPIEREGQLYSPDELQRYFTLPDGEPDRIISFCDTKDRGSDYCSMPIAYQYGQLFYVEDVVSNNGKPELVEEELALKLVKHKVRLARFESNSAGGRVAQSVDARQKQLGGNTTIVTKWSQANKETRIIDYAPIVKECFLFKDDTVIDDKEYRQFLQRVCSWSMVGKNKHDDDVDALAGLAKFTQELDAGKTEVFKRPW